MNTEELLKLASQIMGRDLKVDLDLFYQGRAAIGKCLDEQGQQFFIHNYRTIPAFMETPEGQKAIVTFLNAWAETLIPQAVVPNPAPKPAPLPALAGINPVNLTTNGEVSKLE